MADAKITKLNSARGRVEPIEVFPYQNWHGEAEQPLEWMVENCIPKKSVCLFSGDSGLGKSLMLQQLQTACVLGVPWLGFQVQQCKSFALYCEDPKNVLHIRQSAINRHYACDFTDLEGAEGVFAVGKDNILVNFNQKSNLGQETVLYDQIYSHIRDSGAQIVIVDTLAHTFAGNENIRQQVTAFVNALQRIANEIDGAVILSSHPSVTALASGTGFSGSTAWKATVRAHLYLKRPKGYDPEDSSSDHDARVLTSMKANWGPGGGMTKIRWDQGVFRLEDISQEPGIGHGAVADLTMERIVMTSMDYARKRDIMVSPRPSSMSSLWAISITSLDAVKALGKDARHKFELATERLIKKGRLVACDVVEGRGQPVTYLRGSDRPYPGEVGHHSHDGAGNPVFVRTPAVLPLVLPTPVSAAPAAVEAVEVTVAAVPVVVPTAAAQTDFPGI